VFTASPTRSPNIVVRRPPIPPKSPGPVAMLPSVSKTVVGGPVIIASGVRRIHTTSATETETTAKTTTKTTTKTASGASKETQSSTTTKSKNKNSFTKVLY
jgi:hypothetical protein